MKDVIRHASIDYFRKHKLNFVWGEKGWFGVDGSQKTKQRKAWILVWKTQTDFNNESISYGCQGRLQSVFATFLC